MNDLLGGRYRVVTALGRGGMGTVYEAVQEGLGRHVALKVLDLRLSDDREQLERFRREAEVVASLGHPNIVQVTDFQYPDAENQQPFLVMELLRGESLGSRLAREQVLPAARVAFIAAQVLSALVAAHRAGIVHRDIKPDNIFLLADAAVPDTVKVLDFGIAKLSVDGQAKLTGTGAMLGTPAFMAPEQARGADDVDARADIYAVGATMYQALSGRLPYEAPSIPALLFAIVEKTPVPLHELRPDLPSELVAIIERAMAKDRAARFPDADTMRRALAPWSGLPASIPPPISATAATISSGSVAPYVGQTPIVVHRTPTPASIGTDKTMLPASHASPQLTPVVVGPPAPPAQKKWLVRSLIIFGVLAFGIVSKFFSYLDARDRRASEERSAREHVGANVSMDTPSGSAVTSTSTSTSTVTSTNAVTPVHTATVNAASSVTLATTTSTPALPTATAGSRRYGGVHAFYSGGQLGGCGCDVTAFAQTMEARKEQISACFKASVDEPPLHENVYYDVHVDSGGNYTSFASTSDVTPRLDRCLQSVVYGVKLARTSNAADSFTISFRGECIPGQTVGGNKKWCD